MSLDTSNKLFQLAADLVNHSSQNIFLTGKAGTGKTTFLKYIKENCAKQIAVIAPTGVAAINAGGTTIHSFFQLPFSPFVPGHINKSGINSSTETINKHSLIGRIKMTNERRKILQSLDLLIIDEISMVRCDMLDAIDTVLRHFRSRHNEAFGGVQLLLIGDMFQLPPVVKDDEWNILSQFYNSPYFFSSQVIQQSPPVYISFEKIYRQTDQQFINLLNQVRNNDMDETAMHLLHTRYLPQFQATKEDGYIILTTHNNKAENTNAGELNKLKTPSFSFKATIEGEFYEKAFPAEQMLNLKEGAQVMFIKNDKEKVRRYFNGKIGTVTKIDNENIFVQCKDDAEPIEVSKERWENIRYSLNKTNQQIEDDVIGSFTQFPLRLAWAITIHKSQGLTFEKAIIDAGSAFAPGQVYVALSRCTNMEGLVLHSRINNSSLHADERIHAFSQNIASLSKLEKQLIEAKHLYQQSLLKSLFNFLLINQSAEDVVKLVKNNASSLNAEAVQWAENFFSQMISLHQVAEKFTLQLETFLQSPVLPQQNADLQKRITASSKYFNEQLNSLIKFLLGSKVITDSRVLAKQFNETVYELFSQLTERTFLFETCINGFNAEDWHQKKKEFKLPQFSVNAYAGVSSYSLPDSPHPLLYQQLKKLRDEICSKNNQPIYIVAGSSTLNEMARYLPQNVEELIKISGFGKVKVDAYGERFLNVIKHYSEQYKLSSLIHEKSPKSQRKEKSEPKPNTKLETFKLYKDGKTVEEIATIRNFTTQTIEGHLAHYVSTGEIKINDLVSREKLVLIEPALNNFEGGNITYIKQKLGGDVSFGEIKLAIAWKEFQKTNAGNV